MLRFRRCYAASALMLRYFFSFFRAADVAAAMPCCPPLSAGDTLPAMRAAMLDILSPLMLRWRVAD